MLILQGKYKGCQPKKNGKGYLVGVEGEGFSTHIVHVKADDLDQFKSIQKGQDVSINVYPFSFKESESVQFSYIKK